MDALDLVRLRPLMSRNQGRPEITVALIDGPVILTHPEFSGTTIREISGKIGGICKQAEASACAHGTFVAGVLFAQRGSLAPAICPGCTLLVRPIFAENIDSGHAPSATPEELAEAIVDSVDAGARIINLSSSIAHLSVKSENKLQAALNYSARRGVITVAATGNDGMLVSSTITRHPWVIPAAACNRQGRPLNQSNLGSTIGRRGLIAPGENITSIGTNGKPEMFGGTSAAAPFITGAIALLWSEFPGASSAEVKLAITRHGEPQRNTLVPALLNAEAAYQVMSSGLQREGRL